MAVPVNWKPVVTVKVPAPTLCSGMGPTVTAWAAVTTGDPTLDPAKTRGWAGRRGGTVAASATTTITRATADPARTEAGPIGRLRPNCTATPVITARTTATGKAHAGLPHSGPLGTNSGRIRSSRPHHPG